MHLKVDESRLEEISAYLFAMGCQGINVGEKEIIVYYSKTKWTEEIRQGIVQFISQIIPGFSRANLKIKSITDQDWNRSWKESFRPIRISKQVVVQPPWEEYHKSPGDVVLTINPQMAFGTGHHESTQLAAMSLEEIIQPGMEILDAGTGSGILAIMAEKLGAATAVGFDNDDIAVANAIENRDLNKCSNTRLYSSGLSQFPKYEYDIVIANINRNVLLEHTVSFSEFLKAGGKLIVSGILVTDENVIVKNYLDAGFKLFSKSAKKEWLSVTFEWKSENKTSGQ